MVSDPQLELRVSRLENDTGSIYEILGEIRSTQQDHSLRLDGIDQRLDGFDRRFDSIEGTLTEVLRRLPESS